MQMHSVNEFTGEHEEIKTMCAQEKKKTGLNGMDIIHSDQIGRTQRGGEDERRVSVSLLTTHVPRGGRNPPLLEA